MPMSVDPSSNWTVPGADGLTVAVSVTEVPDSWGLAGDAVKVVVVAVSVTAGYTTDQVPSVESIEMSAES